MVRTALAAVILAAAPALAHAQSATAPLIVTATVVSTCSVDVPRSAEASIFATMPVSVTCAKGGTTPRVQRPIAPQLTVGRTSLDPTNRPVSDAVLIINF
jgi:hypothetical protein